MGLINIIGTAGIFGSAFILSCSTTSKTNLSFFKEKASHQCWAVVKFTISDDGRPEKIRLVEYAPQQLNKNMVKKSIQRWKYKKKNANRTLEVFLPLRKLYEARTELTEAVGCHHK